MDPRSRFRINAVSERTGVPEATLRAWERRYQVPMPERTPSGYRLYSPSDVEQVKQIRALCEAGVSPAEAARRVAELRAQDAAAKTQSVDEPTSEERRASLRFMESLHVDGLHKGGLASVADISLLIDKAATILAARHRGHPMLVVEAEKLQLFCAAREGDLIELFATVIDEGDHGIIVEVRCTIERLTPPERDLLTRTQVTLVPVNAAEKLVER